MTVVLPPPALMAMAFDPLAELLGVTRKVVVPLGLRSDRDRRRREAGAQLARHYRARCGEGERAWRATQPGRC